MSTGPRIGVIMTCYNEGAYIGAAVRSVLQQTRADLIAAVVIADDGSQADTIAVLREIESWDARIRILYGAGGVGLPGQRNRAIAELAPDIDMIAILDGDDLWMQDKLERQVPMLANAEIGLVYGGFSTFPDGDLSAARAAPVIDISRASRLSETYFLNDPPIIPSATLIRRKAFEACGGFDASVRVFEDTDFYLRMARVCRFGFVDAPLLLKRNRRSSITGGRRDLMAHHAYVALKAAAGEPALLRLVPKRLAERARKLANHRFLTDELDDARRLIAFALRLDPFAASIWLSWLVIRAPDWLVAPLKRRLFRGQRAALAASPIGRDG